MTQYNVDSDAVLAGSAAISNTVSRVQSDVTTLHSQLIALEGSWTGHASIAFQGIVSEWRATQLRVEESLQSIQQALALAGQQYAEVEQANSRMFAG